MRAVSASGSGTLSIESFLSILSVRVVLREKVLALETKSGALALREIHLTAALEQIDKYDAGPMHYV